MWPDLVALIAAFGFGLCVGCLLTFAAIAQVLTAPDDAESIADRKGHTRSGAPR